MVRITRTRAATRAAPARFAALKSTTKPTATQPTAPRARGRPRARRFVASQRTWTEKERSSEPETSFMSGALPVDDPMLPARRAPEEPGTPENARGARKESLHEAVETTDLELKNGKSAIQEQPADSTTVAASPTVDEANMSSPAQKPASRGSPRGDETTEFEDLTNRNPSPVCDTDEELYGLSPSGKASQARIQQQFAARRLSQQQAPSVLGTPAGDVSLFAKFQRRPRQSSMLRMIQRDSSVGARTEIDETLDDFTLPPEDESTPLHVNGASTARASIGSNRTLSSGGATSSSRKRKHEEILVPQSPQMHSSPPPSPVRSPTATLSDSYELPAPDEVIPSTEQHGQRPQLDSETMADPLSSSVLSGAAESSPRVSKRRKSGDDATKSAPTTRPARKKAAPRATAISTAHLSTLLPKPRRRTRAATRDRSPYDIPSTPPEDTSMLDLPSSPLTSPESSPEPAPRRRTTTASTQRRILSKASGNTSGKPKAKPKPTTKTKSQPTRTRKPTTPARKLPPHSSHRNRRPSNGTDKENEHSPSPSLSPAPSTPPASPSPTPSPARPTPETKPGPRTYGRSAAPANGTVSGRPGASSRRRPAEDRGTGAKGKGTSKAKQVRSKELAAARRKFAAVDDYELAFESVEGEVGEEGWR